MPEAKKTYSGIDLFKLIASFLVVVLHAIDINNAWYYLEIKFVITSYAVPFFFITSGYFFYRGLNSAKNKKEYFIKYEMNILKIFFVWAILITLPFEVLTYIKKYPASGVIKIFLYLFRRIFIIGPGPYWYLISLMWSALFLYICNKYNFSNIIIYIGIFGGLFFQILYTCFQGLFSNIYPFRYIFQFFYFFFSGPNNFVMYGIPFMGIGYIIAKKNYNIENKISVIMFIVSTIARIFEYNLPQIINSDFWLTNQISFAYIIQSCAFFMLAKNINLNIKNETSFSFRKLSSCIYFSHAIFMWEIITPILIKYTNLQLYQGTFILLKIILSLSLCILLFIIVKKINNKHLNILING